MYRPWNLPLWYGVLPWRRPCALHILCRGISSLHSSHRNVTCNGHDLVLQLCTQRYMAVTVAGVQTARSLWLVRRMEYYRVLSGEHCPFPRFYVLRRHMYLLLSLAWFINMWIPQVLFFLPETKEKTLEELDAVFNVPLRVHAKYGRKWPQKQPSPWVRDPEP